MYEEKPIKNIIIRDYDGLLIKLYNDSCIDSLVTPDHRVFCKTRTTDSNKQFKWSDYRFISGNKLPTAFKIPVTAQVDRNKELKIDDDLLKILGWIITDGSKHEFRKHNSFAYEIYQSKKKNVKTMTDVILRRFPKTTINSRMRKEGIINGIEFKRKKEYTFYFGTEVSKEIENWLKNKTHRIPRIIVEKASTRQLEVLLDSLIEGDGTVQYSKNKFKYVIFYAGKNPELANDVQEICILLGLSAIIKKVKQNNQFKVLISYKRKWASVKKTKENMYNGKVWDITVDNETFIARRKGKSFITGNCPEARLDRAISKSIIETIAREGRKFFTSIVLVSQRPVKLSTTALSQCNTHVIMRILNPYDLDYIGRSSEGIDRSTMNSITSLGVGEAIIVGNAVNHPIFVRVRKRKTTTMETESLEESAKNFEA